MSRALGGIEYYVVVYWGRCGGCDVVWGGGLRLRSRICMCIVHREGAKEGRKKNTRLRAIFACSSLCPGVQAIFVHPVCDIVREWVVGGVGV